MEVPSSIPRHFGFGDGGFLSWERIGVGHIHDTFVGSRLGASGEISRHVFQRINRKVFPDVDALMENVERVTRHLGRSTGGACLRLAATTEGRAFHRTSTGECWRVFPYIEGTVTVDVVGSPARAAEAGRAFGRFARSLSDLPPPRLHETIPGFHDTPKRLCDFIAAVEADPLNRAGSARREIETALSCSHWAGRIDEARQAGEVPERIAHNDAKIENVLFDAVTGAAACVVDLDTVMPGTVLHDFGDLVRTAAATAVEDERDLGRVGVSTAVFTALAEGFLSACGDILTPGELALLPFAGKLIAYEQALRFLGDHLLGDPYYKTNREGHNLQRARNQLRLALILDEKREALETIISNPHAPCS